MRPVLSSGRAARGLVPRMLVVGAIAFIVAAPSLSAQGDCALTVKPRGDSTGYRKRGVRCEGMFVGLQSAPLKVQVVSLIKGGLRYDVARDSLLFIQVPWLPAAVNPRDTVVLQGRGREANLNWALDAFARESTSVRWELDQVIRPEGLNSERIGLVAQAHTSALRDPLFIPLGVSRDSAVRATSADSLELVVRIPSASAVRWAFASDDKCADGVSASCQEASRLNVDGYFRIKMPPGPRGEVSLAIYWRARGSPGFNEVPEHLRIFR